MKARGLTSVRGRLKKKIWNTFTYKKRVGEMFNLPRISPKGCPLRAPLIRIVRVSSSESRVMDHWPPKNNESGLDYPGLRKKADPPTIHHRVREICGPTTRLRASSIDRIVEYWWSQQYQIFIENPPDLAGINLQNGFSIFHTCAWKRAVMIACRAANNFSINLPWRWNLYQPGKMCIFRF